MFRMRLLFGMKCPRCGCKMELDCEINAGGKPIKVYRCRNCGEMAHK